MSDSAYASRVFRRPVEAVDTLPERLALARSRSLGHGEFLELVLADEVARRDSASADLRARVAGLDPSMRFEVWDHDGAVNYDRVVFDELASLRFVEAGHNALILGPVGVCTSSAPTDSSSGSRRPASTTATTPRCAS